MAKAFAFLRQEKGNGESYSLAILACSSVPSPLLWGGGVPLISTQCPHCKSYDGLLGSPTWAELQLLLQDQGAQLPENPSTLALQERKAHLRQTALPMATQGKKQDIVCGTPSVLKSSP